MAVRQRIKPTFKLIVQGPGVRHGIDVPILLQICEHAQAVVNRQAEALEGKQTLRRGPITAKAVAECTLKLVGYRTGSSVFGFSFAKPQQHLPLPATPTFAEEAIRTVAETVRAFAGRRTRVLADADVGVLDSLNSLGRVIDRKVVTSVAWHIPRRNGRGHI